MADGSAPYGDVDYADPGYQSDKQKRYPIDTEEHIRAAWSYINQADNASKYSSEDLAKVKSKIKAAMSRIGADVSDGDGDGSDGKGRSASRPVERRFTSSLVGVMLTGGAEERSGGAPRHIGGYAAKFNVYSRDLGYFVEQIGTTCFNKSRGDGWPDVICRFNHDDNQLLGTIAGGTLTLNTDRDGLLYDVEPPPRMQHIIDLVERRDVQKSSFAFRSVEDEWDMTSDGGPLRTVHSAQLIDVAPVVTPAYADTTAGLRSLAEHFDADFEEVRSLAETRELRKFFVRTDRSSIRKPMYPAAAMAQLLERRADPFEE